MLFVVLLSLASRLIAFVRFGVLCYSLFMNDSEFEVFVEGVVASYRGDATLLGAAIGALVLGRLVGWRVLRVVYSNPTYLKYERALGIQFKEVLPERGRYAYKSVGLRMLDRIGGFWEFVRSRSSGPAELKAVHYIIQ